MRWLTLLVCGLVAGVVPAAFAGTLPITFGEWREDTTGITLNYVYTGGTTGHLSATGGSALFLFDNGVQTARYANPTFDLEATIDVSTGKAVSGTMLLTYGTSPVNTIWNSTTLVDSGAAADFSELDFTFIQSGASKLGGVTNGTYFAIELVPISGWTAGASPVDWKHSFSGTGLKNDGGIDTPAPTAAGAGIMLFFGLGAMSRLRRSRPAA